MWTWRRRVVAGAGMLLGGLWSGGAAWAVNGTPTWSLSLVSPVDPGYFVSSPVLAFDHYGTPSLSWSAVATGPGVNTVRHSQLTGLNLWAHRDVATGAGVGIRTAISFDRAERPTVVWINGDNSVQGEFNAGTEQSVSPTGASVTTPILTATHDLAGNLRGSFYGLTTGSFQSIGYSGGSFSSGAMTTLGGVSAILDGSMTVDDRGLRHLATRSVLAGGNQAVTLASEPAGGGAWPSGNLVTGSAVDGVDIATDPTDGRLALAYTTFDAGTGTSRLFYSKFNGPVVQTTELFASTANRYLDVSLAFDLADGRPAIAFERRVVASAQEQLMFSYLDAGLLWQTGLVDGSVQHSAPNAMPRRPSLAFDDFGTTWPAIGYVDADGSLSVAFDPPAPEPWSLCLMGLAAALAGPAGRRRR